MRSTKGTLEIRHAVADMNSILSIRDKTCVSFLEALVYEMYGALVQQVSA